MPGALSFPNSVTNRADGGTPLVTGPPLTIACAFQKSADGEEDGLVGLFNNTVLDEFYALVSTTGDKLALAVAEADALEFASTAVDIVPDRPNIGIGWLNDAASGGVVLNAPGAVELKTNFTKVPEGINRLTWGSYRNAVTNSHPLDGYIFWSAVWNRVISPEERAAILAGGRPLDVARPGLLHYHEAQGGSLTDLASGSLTLAVTNADFVTDPSIAFRRDTLPPPLNRLPVLSDRLLREAPNLVRTFPPAWMQHYPVVLQASTARKARLRVSEADAWTEVEAELVAGRRNIIVATIAADELSLAVNGGTAVTQAVTAANAQTGDAVIGAEIVDGVVQSGGDTLHLGVLAAYSDDPASTTALAAAWLEPVVSSFGTSVELGDPVDIDISANVQDPSGWGWEVTAVTALDSNATWEIAAGAHGVTITPDGDAVAGDVAVARVSVRAEVPAAFQRTVTLELSATFTQTAFSNGFLYRRLATIPAASIAAGGVSTGIVVLIQETRDFLKADSETDGRLKLPGGEIDIRFETTTGTILPHDIERHVSTTGELIAWVRLPSLPASVATTFYLYYGRATAPGDQPAESQTWQDYLASWDCRTGEDRTGNGRTLTPADVGSGTLMGDAGEFAGAGSLRTETVDWLDGLSAVTWQVAITATALGSNRGPFAQGPINANDPDHGVVMRYTPTGFRGGASQPIIWSVLTDGGIARFESSALRQSTGVTWLWGTWASGELPALQVDDEDDTASWRGKIVANVATEDAAITGVTELGTGNLLVGGSSWDTAAGGWLGLIDELRVRNEALSAAHRLTEYRSYATPQFFYGLGAEEQPGGETPTDPTFANGYAWRSRIVVPAARVQGSTALPAFLMWFDETDTRFKTVANGGKVTSDDGWDIRFEDSAGLALPYAIETWDGSTGRLACWIRVGITPLADTTFYVYLGKTLTATEEDEAGAFADYVVAWNARTGVDRTGRDLDLTPSGSPGAGTLMGDCADLDGTDDFLSASLGSALAGMTQLTLQMWAKPDAGMIGDTRGFFCMGPLTDRYTSHTIALGWRPSNAAGTVANPFLWNVTCGTTAQTQAYMLTGPNRQTSNAQMVHGTWISGEAPKLYLDGEHEPPSSSSPGTGATVVLPVGGTGDVYIGKGPSFGSFIEDGPFSGLIDEVRIRALAMSPEWIATEYQNQNAPELFYGLGPVDGAQDSNQGPVAVPVSVLTPEDTAVLVDVAAASLDPEGGALTVTAVGTPDPSGTAVIETNKLRYTPASGYVGLSEFTYTLEDAGVPAKSASSRVRVESVASSQLDPEYPQPVNGSTTVDNDAEFTSALVGFGAGKEIILNPGNYTLARTFAMDGTQGQPAVIRAVQPLATTINGGQWFTTGDRLLIHGLNFRGDVNTRVKVSGFDNIIRRCDFAGWRGQAISPKNGHDGDPLGGRVVIDYCSFHDPIAWDEPAGGPEPSRVAIRVRSNSTTNFHYGGRVRHCHFYNLPEKAGAPDYYGQSDAAEWAPDGSSHPNLNNAGWLAEYILFEDCDGRDAVLDLKSGGNILRYLTLLNCYRGRLDNRYWNGNRWEGIWLENCSGMDFLGTDHIVNGVKMINGPGGPTSSNPRLAILAGVIESNATVAPPGQQQYQRPQRVKIIGADGGEIWVGHQYNAATQTKAALDSRIEAKTNCIIQKQTATAWAQAAADKLETGTTYSATASEAIVTPIKQTTNTAGATAAWVG